ncbi:ABC transporter permease [Natronospora cellulosivora (SeqCode)]
MILKMLKKDFLRKKLITVAVFIFIMLSALLMSSGISIVVNLLQSLDYLFEASSAPHFVQLHIVDRDEDKVDEAEIREWSQNNLYIKEHQIGQMVNIHGSNVYINSDIPEHGTVMDLYFVKQNKRFDFLLDLNNEVIELSEGEIAVPIYYMQEKNLSIGDKLVIREDDHEYVFVIADFLRDVQMNPSIISSKRFLLSDYDFERINYTVGETEYLISFQLLDQSYFNEVSNDYLQSGLPQKGPTIGSHLFRIFNSLTDGFIAGIIIFISLLLTVIVLLCLRFIIILSFQEDYKEIAGMKAIGISSSDIKAIYLIKYITLITSASLLGYFLSFFINDLFSQNILLYIGEAPGTIFTTILPLISIFFVVVLLTIFCKIILRRLGKVSAVEALRMGEMTDNKYSNKKFTLYKSKILSPPIFLGIRDVLLNYRIYTVLFLVFLLSTFIVIVPINFYNTIESPEFVRYMGMGKSDIFVDLRHTERVVDDFYAMIEYLENDPDVKKYSSFVTSQYEIKNLEGTYDRIYVETGDFRVFPLNYLKGMEPDRSNEIALSYLIANDLGKEPGDNVELIIDGKTKSMFVTGVYQDITNGGRSAKANIQPNYETASWYNINIDLRTDIRTKILEYESIFPDATITDMQEHLRETFANTVEQLRLLTVFANIVAFVLIVFITSLFLKTLIAKDMSQIAIKRSIGIPIKKIRIEYLSKALFVLNLGIISGTIIANTIGQRILGIVFSFLGAANIEFVIKPLETYVLIPLMMLIIVSLTSIISIRSMKKYSIADINAE